MPGRVELPFHPLTRRRRDNPANEPARIGLAGVVVLGAMSTKGQPEDIFPLIYSELRKVARRYLGRERKNHTLQPTALVNEAWLRLENQHGSEWQGRTHGLALAAQAMRRLLVDHGRHQKRQKRGGGAAVMQLDELVKAATTGAVPVEDLLTLEAALTRLETVDPRAAQVVSLRFFSGLSAPEVATHLGVSLRTVEADWTHARAWLKREMSGEGDAPGSGHAS